MKTKEEIIEAIKEQKPEAVKYSETKDVLKYKTAIDVPEGLFIAYFEVPKHEGNQPVGYEDKMQAESLLEFLIYVPVDESLVNMLPNLAIAGQLIFTTEWINEFKQDTEHYRKHVDIRIIVDENVYDLSFEDLEQFKVSDVEDAKIVNEEEE